MSTLSKNKVVLGLSGGVDSTTAALLLKEKGFSVIGFYFDVLGNNEKGRKAAENLAKQLEIPFFSMDVSGEFDETIIGNFCSEYSLGRTPNPCVLCNPTIKFKKLLQIADENGAYYISTGHYARVFHEESTDIYYIRKGANQRKDQSYMLYRLGRNVLSRLILPLGEIADKERTRALARQHEMPNADTVDSQEICFIDDKKEDYAAFLSRRGVLFEEGDFVDAEGSVLGRHQGVGRYTIGQRKGLGIALGKPAFVTAIDAENNRVVLGDNQALFTREVKSSNNFFTATDSDVLPEDLMGKSGLSAKIRYKAEFSPVSLSKINDNRILAVFEEPQRAAAPGQSMVFYDGELVVGGGFID